MFAPEDVATDAQRVFCFRRGLRDEIRVLCRSAQTLSYTEFFNMALAVEDDQASMKKSTIISQGGFG